MRNLHGMIFTPYDEKKCEKPVCNLREKKISLAQTASSSLDSTPAVLARTQSLTRISSSSVDVTMMAHSYIC